MTGEGRRDAVADFDDHETRERLARFHLLFGFHRRPVTICRHDILLLKMILA